MLPSSLLQFIELVSFISLSLFLFKRYLSPDSFYKVFEMNFQEFNRLPLWRRNDLKKIVNLF